MTNKIGVPKLALASIMSDDDSVVAANFKNLPPIESGLFSPDLSLHLSEGKSSAVAHSSSQLQFLSDHEFDLGLNALHGSSNNVKGHYQPQYHGKPGRNSPPLEIKTIDSSDLDASPQKAVHQGDFGSVHLHDSLELAQRAHEHRPLHQVLQGQAPDVMKVDLKYNKGDTATNKYSQYYNLHSKKMEESEKIQHKAKLPFKSRSKKNVSQPNIIDEGGGGTRSSGGTGSHGRSPGHQRSQSDSIKGFLKPLRRNYYSEMSTSKFMQKYEAKRVKGLELAKSPHRTSKDSLTEEPPSEKQDSLHGSHEWDYTKPGLNQTRDSLELTNTDFYDMKSPSQVGGLDNSSAMGMTMIDGEDDRAPSPVNSYLSVYRTRETMTKSAPALSKYSVEKGSKYNDERKLGATNLTIFNEIYEKKNTAEKRNQLRSKQLDYSRRLNFQHRHALDSAPQHTKHILSKLQENIDKATDGSQRTTTRQRFETMSMKRNRAVDYAKTNIPKPRVVKRLGIKPEDLTHVPQFKAGKPVVKSVSSQGLRKGGAGPIANKPTGTITKVRKFEADHRAGSPKGSKKEEKSGDNELDDLLEYMLDRHKNEQNKLKSIA